MKTQKLLKILTLAIGFLTAGFSFGLNGDIFEIKPCDENGLPKDYGASITKPLTSGDAIYFNVRLIGRDYHEGTTSFGRWYLEHKGSADEILDSLSAPLMLGIYVSGKVQYAELHKCLEGGVDGTSRFTDLVFKYVTKPGDVALPIVLQTSGGPASDVLFDDASYMIYNTGKWALKNAHGDTCNLWYWEASEAATAEIPEAFWRAIESPDDPSGERTQDSSLAKCNFYVQTVDFDDTWQIAKGEANELWRSVHERSTITADGLTPKLKAIAAPTEKVTLYVWSDNEEAVFVKSSELVDLQNSNVPGDTVKTHIGTVTIAGGQVYADFQIEGANGGQGRTANLILSPWKNYNYSDATGARIIDYVKVPVKCLEPLPPTITVETDRQIAYANGNYMVYGAVLSVYLSEAYTADMVVKITPTLSDGNAAEMGDYLRFSETQTEVTALPDYQIPTVTIPAGSTAKKQLYVFILRGDTRTSGTSRIVFTPSVEDAAAQSFIKNTITAGMQVVAEKPVITLPEEGAEFFGICGSETPFNLVVEDTYADSSDFTEGYQILVKYRPTDLWAPLNGRYCIGEGGALYLIDEKASGIDRKTTKLPTLNYPVSGEAIQSQVKVISPISGKESEIRNFVAKIKAPRLSDVIEATEKYEFREGEQGQFKITISEPNDTGNTIYAFLKASDNIKAGMLSGTPLFVVCEDTDLTKTRGLAINKNNSETSVSRIKFLDGLGEEAGGLSVQFEVVLCSTSRYDESKIIPGYDSNYLNLTVYNEEPVIKRLEMNGIESEVDGYTYPNKYPKGMTRKFVAVVDDKGAYDKTTTEVGEEFQCKWTIKREGMNYGDPVTKLGDPAANPFEFNFPQAGKWTIRLQVKDKDMDDWAATDYEVHVNILDNPFVEITSDETYSENEKSKTIKVGLSYWDDNYFDTLKVKVTVDNWVAGKENYGYFILDGAFKSTDPADGDNVYYVDLRNQAPADIRITQLDGTENSSLYGFKVTAEVVSTTILPTSGQSANTYYLKAENQVLVNNVAPQCEMIPEPSTNRWVVSGGVDKTHPLNWKVKSDVINDFTGLWEGVATNGVKVSIFGPVNATEFYVSEATSDTFYPDFGDMQGDVDVTFLFEDKDGGSVTYVYQYKVTPSKFLITSAHGPGGGLATSPLSRKYALLDTLGSGHTYAKDVTFSSADNFRLKWNCGTRTYAEVYAFGYKVANPVDDGKLNNGQDIPIDSAGFHQPLTGDGVDFYNYPLASISNHNERVDSFFYCWLIHTTDKDGKTSSSILGDTFSPEGIEPGKVAVGRVPLPTEETKDGNYINTEVEALFAKEYLPEDNLGDINLDGIPDAFAHKEWGAGNMIKLASGGEEVENNLINLAKFNGDGDTLPKAYMGGNNNFNYAPIGPEFTARLEIRGFHDGLNNVGTSQARFCDIDEDGMPKREKGKLVNANELLAWRAFKKAKWEAKRDELLAEDPEATVEPFDETMLPTNATDLAEWSPEPSSKNFPRMDPTVEDTDGDGFPDGWEYYIWYRAHVTARVPDSKVRYERFNPDNILVGIEISADDVEARFNPCVPLSGSEYGDDPDFDKDGLSDLEELAIGTNPCHWDTDGDGMCDGWEVSVNLDPLSASDKNANADGDFMAYLDLGDVPGVTNVDGTVTFYPLLVRGVDYSIESEEDEDGNLILLPETFALTGDIKNTLALTVKGLTTPVKNEDDVIEDVPVYYGLESDKDIWGKQLVESMEKATVNLRSTDLNKGVDFGIKLVLLHNQVRDAIGFDPRTAWNNVDGYVANRWNPEKNKAIGGKDTTGIAVNTRAYGAYDEYLVMKYRKEVLKDSEAVDTKDIWKTLLAMTTNPSVIKVQIIDTEVKEDTSNDDGVIDDTSSTNAVTVVTTNSTASATQNTDKTATGVIAELLDKAFKEAESSKATRKGHGADTDGDGVPDGWELYMGRSPSAAPGGEEDGIGKKKAHDFDDDGLSYTAEFAGTDSCNAYKDCASIYNHHPGKSSSWYNKFFPTNPGNLDDIKEAADTDNDGIDDGDEGAGFSMDFYNGGSLYHELKLSFFYGDPDDDGLSTCIRGAGMNPCTVDTDLDGIPDGWEMQHAGVPVNKHTRTVVAPKGVDETSASKVREIKLVDATFIADGIYKKSEDNDSNTGSLTANGTNDTDNVVAVATNTTSDVKAVIYIAGGMDATWKGDAGSEIGDKGLSGDTLLGTARDVDFDHDGLQNYQEYYIQAVRHFRYDDISTPLMGRIMTESGSRYTQTFKGYLEFNPADATNFVAMARSAWGWNDPVINSRVNLVKDEFSSSALEPWTAEGWRNLGYFAPPARHWDRALVSGVLTQPLYMLPVTKKMSDNSAVAGYATTDPRMADTDGDGMDDFYEMFHGLNPILGADVSDPTDTYWAYFGKRGDIISAVYNQAIDPLLGASSLSTFNAYNNEWTRSTFNRQDALTGDGYSAYITAPRAYDPVMYPWLQGTAMADSDGDGIRNDEERILANVADPMPRHTDPTPLWFTERTTPISFVSQYYVWPDQLLSMPWSPGTKTEYQTAAYSILSSTDYMYSFEEGEGYDTDGDFKYDGAEVVTAFTRETDPLKFDDPNRRQALWLNGFDAFAMSPYLQGRAISAPDLLKQFTVECWARPEKGDADQTIIDRSFWYPGDNLASDVAAIRANFRIGISSDGRIYGMFDNNKSIESGSETTKSCQYVNGPKLELNEWAHVALTFDGTTLKLYINGETKTEWMATTKLIPANGVIQITQNPDDDNNFPVNAYTYRQGAFFIGARSKSYREVDLALDIQARKENYTDFFGGYVDEVRIWDGARTAEEIKSNYRKRFGFAEALDNREKVMESWLNGATRNNNDDRANLPPELLFHYNFVTLPGAVDPNMVAKTPAGFISQVVDVANGAQYAQNPDVTASCPAGRSPTINEDICVGWWYNTPHKSTVYTDYRVIPWIKNTVMHLPPVDGSAIDSFLYSEQFGAGYTPATEHGLKKYTFNNTAQPYSSYVLHLDLYQKYFQAEQIESQLGTGFERVRQMAEFALRTSFMASTDILPLGGAYAKTCPKMWDGAVADAWELTLSDSDADSLPDWWEEYCTNNYGPESMPLDWNTIVSHPKGSMTAGEAYKLDIFAGMQPGSGDINPDYQATIDADGDNLPDWWETLYAINDSSDVDDNDGDGLSNWAEYLMSEVFTLTDELGNRVRFDPTKPISVMGSEDLDYFFKIGELYAGEIFSDHDFIEDELEDTWSYNSNLNASRNVWDAEADQDEDSWTNYEEARYNYYSRTIVGPVVSHNLNNVEFKDMPIPTLHLTFRYNGNQELRILDKDQDGESDSGSYAVLAPLVIKTYTDNRLIIHDADYTIHPGSGVGAEHIVGPWKSQIVAGSLTPGFINSQDVMLEYAEMGVSDNVDVELINTTSYVHMYGFYDGRQTVTYDDYKWLRNVLGAGNVNLLGSDLTWKDFGDEFTLRGTFESEEREMYYGETKIGVLNLTTGEYKLDLAQLSTIVPNEVSAALKNSLLQIRYISNVPGLQGRKVEVYLGEAGNGFVRGGKNTIVAFYDLDLNGEYTPGEPFGTAFNVDVSWRQGKAEIELTDVNPIISRLNLATGISDRSAIYGSDESHDRSNTVGRLMVNDFERVRVVRRYTVIRKQSAEGKITESLAYLPVQKVVLDKILTKTPNVDREIKNTRPYLMEGDFLVDGELDIDWSALKDEAIDHPNVKDGIYGQLDLTHIVYEIFLGDGTLPEQNQKADNSTADAHSVLLVRRFDSNDMRPTPEAISPGSKDIQVLRTNPIFKWKLPNPAVPNMVHDGYTAFKIEIRKDGTTVWDSGYQRAPARDIDGVYTFEADAYIGDELKNNETYTWRVSMYNAKFKDDKWSNESSFRMTVPEKIAGYADIPVCVKYFGPSKVKDASTFVVEAFKTPDFTGIPAARVVVDDAAAVTAVGVSHSTNAVLRGLSTGKYFLRAYADMNAGSAVKRKRDSFESWGYACGRGKTVSRIYAPIEFELTSKNGFEKPIDIYIEDVDTNGNSLPDAWEYVTNGGKLDVGTKNLDGDLDGTFSIASVLSDYLRDKVVSGLHADAFNNYIITSFMSPKMMALALGYNPDTVTVGSNGSIQVESKVESVEIKSVSFDDNGNVVVEIEGQLNTSGGNAGGLGIIPVEGETTKTVTCQVLWKSSLSDTEWTVKAEKKVAVGNGAETIDISGVGSETSGFFKVVVTE